MLPRAGSIICVKNKEYAMCSKRDVVLFFAGAEAFHTLSHIVLKFMDVLPIQFLSINFTQQLNMVAIIINAIITAGLLWWASKLK